MSDPRLKSKECDVCKNPATRWFRDTCVMLCDNRDCFDTQEQAWQEELTRLAEEED